MGGWGGRAAVRRDVGGSRNDGLKEEQWSGQQIGPEGRREKVELWAEL